LLRRELGLAVDSDLWREKNHAVGRVFLEHTLLVSDVMVSLELASRKRGDVRLLHEDQLGLPPQSFRWQVKIQNGMKLGVVPDRVFALEYTKQDGQVQR
jgi:hypothetical protein